MFTCIAKYAECDKCRDDAVNLEAYVLEGVSGGVSIPTALASDTDEVTVIAMRTLPTPSTESAHIL